MKEFKRVMKQIGHVLFIASLPFFPFMCITFFIAFLVVGPERSITLAE